MPSQVPDLVEQQFASVFAAPIPFIIACFVAVGFIWFMFSWSFSARIDRHKATIEGLKEERDRLKAKLDEKLSPSAPITQASTESGKPSIQPPTGLQREIEGPPVISTRTHADRLMAGTEGLTNVKARDVIRNAIGQPLTVSGEVFQVTDNMGKVTVTITLDPEQRRSAWMVFDDDLDRIRRLGRRERITVTGIVREISSDEIQMSDCSLT
jgi:hypothetical protein